VIIVVSVLFVPKNVASNHVMNKLAETYARTLTQKKKEEEFIYHS